MIRIRYLSHKNGSDCKLAEIGNQISNQTGIQNTYTLQETIFINGSESWINKKTTADLNQF